LRDFLYRADGASCLHVIYVNIMSLKAFHIAFVLIATAFCVYFGIWGIGSYRDTGNFVNLCLGVASFVAVIALMIYFRWFLKKLKNVGYL